LGASVDQNSDHVGRRPGCSDAEIAQEIREDVVVRGLWLNERSVQVEVSARLEVAVALWRKCDVVLLFTVEGESTS
jgi:hypothetical protein